MLVLCVDASDIACVCSAFAQEWWRYKTRMDDEYKRLSKFNLPLPLELSEETRELHSFLAVSKFDNSGIEVGNWRGGLNTKMNEIYGFRHLRPQHLERIMTVSWVRCCLCPLGHPLLA